MKRTWILCLLIALLPLRGWALSAMAGEGRAQQAGHPGYLAPQLPPCHLDVTDVGDAQSDGHAGAGVSHASGADDARRAGHDGEACSHCAICHAVLGPLSLPLLPACTAAAVGGTPAWSGRQPPARAPDLPFKPPRA